MKRLSIALEGKDGSGADIMRCGTNHVINYKDCFGRRCFEKKKDLLCNNCSWNVLHLDNGESFREFEQL